MSRIFLFFLALAATGLAEKVKLAWDQNPEPDIQTYRVHYGTESRVYSKTVSVGNRMTATIQGLEIGTYYFSVTAVNSLGAESLYSDEVTVTFEASYVANSLRQLPASGGAPNGQITLTWLGLPNRQYDAMVSTDLVTWSPIEVIPSGPNGEMNWVYVIPDNSPVGYFKAKLKPP